MKHTRLVIAALVVAALAGSAVLAAACDGKDHAAAASAKSSVFTPAMAAKCTPEMAAACRAKGTSATAAVASWPQGAMKPAAAVACPHGARSAATAAAGCSYHSGASAVTAASVGGSGKASCGARAASASSGCGSRGAANTTAAGAGRVDAVLTGGASCSGHGTANTADRSAHGDCDACADMSFCDGEVRTIGATVQVLPLKNGVMYVYTAAAPSKVQAVQAAMARRNDRMTTIMTAGDRAHLCPACKSMRGAVASGKLSREIVNIEGGCLTLMTSSDPAMVARIYNLAGLKGPMAVKS